DDVKEFPMSQEFPISPEMSQEISQEKTANERVTECLDMAFMARRRADAAESPADERFWRRMEERWIHLGETYRETDKLRDLWLGTPADRQWPDGIRAS